MTEERPARLVLLGASNLTLGLGHAVRHAVARLGDHPLEIYAAHGPGRSYGVEAGVWWIRYPGIADCGVLETLEEAPGRGGDHPADDQQTWALLTDIGNDILYACGPVQIVSWVERIARRLKAAGARVGVTSLPIESIERMSALKFRILRPLYFPFRPMPFEEVLSHAHSIQESLASLARQGLIHLLPTRASWYGFDHFHLRARCRREAFATWLDALLGLEHAPPAAGGRLLATDLRLRFHPRRPPPAAGAPSPLPPPLPLAIARGAVLNSF